MATYSSILAWKIAWIEEQIAWIEDPVVHRVTEIFQEGSNKMFSLTKMIKK